MTGVGVVRQRNILHPEDQAAQTRISLHLRGLREERFTPGEYAKLLGTTQGNIWGMEQRNQGNMSYLCMERRAAPLGLRLMVDLTHAPEDDLPLAILEMARERMTGTPWDRAAATARLTAMRLDLVRTHVAVSERVLAGYLGLTTSTVNELFRSAGATTRLATHQRIARALGGSAVPRLVPLDGA